MIEIWDAIRIIKKNHCTCNEKCIDVCKYGKDRCVYDMAIHALEIQEKLQKMVETLENNLSHASTCTVIDMSSEYEQAKYQAHYKCFEHLKEILS